ncbi:MAG: biotin/lipoyl-containing protein [Candidatus Aminicenantaceae bacterium]
MNISFWLDNREFRLNLEEKKKNTMDIILDQKKYLVSVEFLRNNELLLNVNGKIYNIIIDFNTSFYSVYVDEKFFKIEKKSASQFLGKQRAKQKKADIKTSMPGRIVKIFLQEGDKIKEGQAVLVLEAMKMENEIKSPQSGIVKKIIPNVGDYVETGSTLFSVE